jgi:heterodisulfide reductase subunit C
MKIIVSANRVRSEFVKKVEELSGQNILACYQCGKCSAGCPVVAAMDILPSQVVRLVQLGQEDVLKSKTIWLCASCFTCASRCPRGVDLSRIMESLREIVLRKGEDFVEIPKIPSNLLDQAPQQALVCGLHKYTS